MFNLKTLVNEIVARYNTFHYYKAYLRMKYFHGVTVLIPAEFLVFRGGY